MSADTTAVNPAKKQVSLAYDDLIKIQVDTNKAIKENIELKTEINILQKEVNSLQSKPFEMQCFIAGAWMGTVLGIILTMVAIAVFKN